MQTHAITVIAWHGGWVVGNSDDDDEDDDDDDGDNEDDADGGFFALAIYSTAPPGSILDGSFKASPEGETGSSWSRWIACRALPARPIEV